MARSTHLARCLGWLEAEDLLLFVCPAIEVALQNCLASVPALNPFLRRPIAAIGDDVGPGLLLLGCAALNVLGLLTAPVLERGERSSRARAERTARVCLAVPTAIMTFWGTFVMHRVLPGYAVVVGIVVATLGTMFLAHSSVRIGRRVPRVARRLAMLPTLVLCSLIAVQGLRGAGQLGQLADARLALSAAASLIYYWPFVWAPRVVASSPQGTGWTGWLLRYLVFLVGLVLGVPLLQELGLA